MSDAPKDAPKPQYPTKARYRVLETSHLNGEVVIVEPGEGAAKVFVEYDGHPGSNLEPADDEAKRRKALYMKMKGATDEQIRANKLKLAGGAFYDPTAPAPAPAPVAELPVQIPEDWKKLQAVPLGLLAFKLSGEEPATAAEATKIIEAEVAKRMGAGSAAG